MSKTLVIIRHAKSTWEYGPIADLDRPLKEIGISNTFIVSQKLKEQGIAPDLIISSPAIRALHTALIVARELRYPCEKIRIDQELYSESEDEILDMVKTTNDNVNILFIFGHNPGFTFLSNRFLKNRIDNLPTSGVALIQFNVTHWADISSKNTHSDMCFFAKK
ncbi:MAG: histidine phosphatase family protein [Bacteroidota bacterium]|nr:histidine phosphatase family protein [Bacteroidota bacterium]